MKKNLAKTILIISLLAIGISACGGGEEAISEADAVLTKAVEVASMGMTETAAAIPPATDTPLPQPTETPTLQPVVNPTQPILPTNALAMTGSPATDGSGATPTKIVLPATSTPVPQQSQGGGADCYKAAFEGEGPPSDNTKITGGKTFTKTWRIKNVGTCPWTSEEVYLKWVGTTYTTQQGVVDEDATELFGQGSVIPIVTETVYPGEHLNIEITFTVPVPKGWATNEKWQAFYMLGTPAGIIPISDGSIWFLILATNPD